jgi:CHAD domain-containing protein
MGPVSVSRAVEIERKYTVADGVALPALERVPGVVSVERTAGVHLDAVYLDTVDRSLLAAGIVVRRRTGGHDAGWHIKLRGPVGRVELHLPIDATDTERLPEAFEAALRTRLRGRPLIPIALIRTERRAVVVVDEAGGGVEVVDDLVSATDVAAGVLRTWREWEAEQAEDSDACSALLDRVDAALQVAGATASASPAKIAQALGLVDARSPSPEPPATAGGVVAAIIAGHAEELHRGVQSLALDGDPDGTVVHALRTVVRRSRAVLALTSVAGPSGAALRDRLGDVGRVLGAVRDPLAVARLADGLLARLDPGTPGLDDARALLVDQPAARAAADIAVLLDRLGAPDVLALLADLEAFAPDGPLVGRRPEALIALGERAVRRAGTRARHPGRLHRARKAAMRARFVVEELVAAGLVPERSKLARAARTHEAAQDVLGDHRDLALLLDGLPAASEQLTSRGANAFAIGRIAEHGRRRLVRLQRAAEQAVRHLG